MYNLLISQQATRGIFLYLEFISFYRLPVGVAKRRPRSGGVEFEQLVKLAAVCGRLFYRCGTVYTESLNQFLFLVFNLRDDLLLYSRRRRVRTNVTRGLSAPCPTALRITFHIHRYLFSPRDSLMIPT